MSSLVDAAQNPLFAASIVFVMGLATSLGPCTFTRAITIIGYVGSEEHMTRGKGFSLAFVSLLGLTLSYISLGLVSFIASNIINIGTNLYIVIGIVMVLMGLHFAGLVRITIPTFGKLRELKSRYSKYRGPTGSFLLGAVFGLMMCPCCLPGLVAIFGLTFAKGSVLYGALLVFVYTLGHGIPILVVGTLTGEAKVLTAARRWSEHVNLLTGTLMIIVGLLFIWIV